MVYAFVTWKSQKCHSSFWVVSYTKKTKTKTKQNKKTPDSYVTYKIL